MSGREQDEGKELFVSMLPNTLEALCSMEAAPHDDTILHHLLDVIRKLIISQDDAQHCGLFDFVDAVKEKAHNLSAAVLVLAVGVASHLTSLTSGSENLWQRAISLYGVIQSSVVAGTSSVGAAYFNSLAKVVACPAGLHWLENNQVHFRTALSTLETAQSIFLRNAAENFVLTTLTTSLEAAGANQMHSSPSSQMVVDGVKLLTSELMAMKRNRATLLDQMIVSSHVSSFHQSVVKLVCALTGLKTFCEWKGGDREFVSVLAHLALQHSSEKIQSSALQGVLNLVGYMNEKMKEEFLKKEILSPVIQMMSEGGVQKGLLVAAAFVKNSLSIQESEVLETLQKLVQLPHDLLFGQQCHSAELAHLVSAVTTSLGDRQRFGRLISLLLYSVKQKNNSDGLVRLMASASLTKDDENWVSVVSSWPQPVGTVVVGNQKLLSSLLDLLQQDSCLDLTLPQCTEILGSLMRIMRRPLVESRLYSQTSTAFVESLRKQYQSLQPGERTGMQKVLVNWVELMEYRLVSVQWEIRDTTLELIRNVIGIVSDSWFHTALLDHHLLRLAWSCTKYGASYPQATAISLATSLTASPLWDIFLQDADITEASLADEMMEVLASNPEAFPRRAAVLLLTALISRWSLSSPTSSPSDRSSQRGKICAAMTGAMNDFDWDVKLKVLDFWEKLAAPLFPDKEDVEGKNGHDANISIQAMTSDRKRTAPKPCGRVSCEEYRDLLETRLTEGLGQALLSGAEDYDSAVKQKALHMLDLVQQQMQTEEHSPVKAQRLHKESSVAKSDSTGPTGEQTSDREPSQLSASVDHFLCSLLQLNPGRQLQQLRRSADEYDGRPASLLEDVMAAVKLATVASEVTLMSEDEFEDADDMFVDCY